MNNPLAPDATIIYYDSVDSTMLEARRLTGSGGDRGSAVVSGTVVHAGYQSEGRGRLPARKWTAGPGEALLFTVIFKKDDLAGRMSGRYFTLLPLLCGLAVASAVELSLSVAAERDLAAGVNQKDGGIGADTQIRIKWPNDVLAGGRKLSGILCEAAEDYLYAGIGINLNQTAFPDDLRRPACSLRMLTGCFIEPSDMLQSVLGQLDSVLADNCWKEMLERRLYKIGEPVVMRVGMPEDFSGPDLPGANGVLKPKPGIQSGVEVSGRLIGISMAGELLLDTPEGIVPVVSGELVF